MTLATTVNSTEVEVSYGPVYAVRKADVYIVGYHTGETLYRLIDPLFAIHI